MKKNKFTYILPKSILILNEIFVGNGYELYLVGGAVRDMYMGSMIKDFDLATNARPNDIESILNKNGIKTIPTGKKFGIINAFINKEEYEIATFRADTGEYSDGRRPDSVTFSDIETDVTRRDLTINALFYKIDTSEIVDYVGGIDDINNKIIRTVGEAEKRFEEDKLRILRAIRFTYKYDGFMMDKSIIDYIYKNNNLDGISKERIRDEFIKAIKSASNVTALLTCFDRLNLMSSILSPDIYLSNEYINTNNYLFVITKLFERASLYITIDTLKKLNYTNTEINHIVFLIKMYSIINENVDIYELKKYQKSKNITFTNKDILEYFKLSGQYYNPKFLKSLTTYLDFNLTIKSEEIINEGYKGPEIGEMIRFRENLKYSLELTNKE